MELALCLEENLMEEPEETEKFALEEWALEEENLLEEFGLDDYSFDTNPDTEVSQELIFSGKKFFELYDYQYMIKQQAMNDLENPDKDLYKILIHMPTGTGKTKTTMHIISHYVNFVRGGKGLVVWIAHTNELLQ